MSSIEDEIDDAIEAQVDARSVNVVSSSDRSEVTETENFTAILEYKEPEDVWNVKVVGPNADEPRDEFPVWVRDYDERSTAEDGAESALHQHEQEYEDGEFDAEAVTVEENAAVSGDDPESEAFEPVRGTEAEPGDTIRLHLGPNASMQLGEAVITGHVIEKNMGKSVVPLDVGLDSPLIWTDMGDENSDELRHGGEKIGYASHAYRLKGMGASEAQVEAYGGGHAGSGWGDGGDDDTLEDGTGTWRLTRAHEWASIREGAEVRVPYDDDREVRGEVVENEAGTALVVKEGAGRDFLLDYNTKILVRLANDETLGVNEGVVLVREGMGAENAAVGDVVGYAVYDPGVSGFVSSGFMGQTLWETAGEAREVAQNHGRGAMVVSVTEE